MGVQTFAEELAPRDRDAGLPIKESLERFIADATTFTASFDTSDVTPSQRDEGSQDPPSSSARKASIVAERSRSFLRGWRSSGLFSSEAKEVGTPRTVKMPEVFLTPHATHPFGSPPWKALAPPFPPDHTWHEVFLCTDRFPVKAACDLTRPSMSGHAILRTQTTLHFPYLRTHPHPLKAAVFQLSIILWLESTLPAIPPLPWLVGYRAGNACACPNHEWSTG